ncbi:hypothetical protein Cni_G18226 [Canna indica]|uniref:Uncharacterized protein n=1 Tax=Canna indica TaxID=4628 RepID=A0AAQ3KLU4_9LILI|nr:hypothetical protein Cni_G18226 [Canna indica]
MGSKLRLVRNVNQSRRFRFIALAVGCFVVTMTFLVVSKPQSLVLSNFGFGPSMPPPQLVQDMVNGDDNGIQKGDSAHVEREEAQRSQVLESNDEKEEGEKNIVVDATIKDQTDIHEFTETATDNEESGTKPDQDEAHNRLALPTISNYTINDRTQVDTTVVPERLGQSIMIRVEKAINLKS